jgi:hypothetical protein
LAGGLGVGAIHFGAGFIGCEHPFDASAVGIASLLPGRGFGDARSVAIDAPTEALVGEGLLDAVMGPAPSEG